MNDPIGHYSVGIEIPSFWASLRLSTHAALLPCQMHAIPLPLSFLNTA
jgi:hypothetical protein